LPLPSLFYSTDFAKLAVEADNRNEWEEAMKNYMLAVEYFHTHMKYDKNPTSVQAIRAKVKKINKNRQNYTTSFKLY
jgi:MIT (microtubule interacting and transport) domain